MYAPKNRKFVMLEYCLAKENKSNLDWFDTFSGLSYALCRFV